MSAIVDFRLIKQNKLAGLIKAIEPTKDRFLFFKWENDNYMPYLKEHTKTLKDIDVSGFVYNNVLVYFEKKLGLSFDKNELDDVCNELTEKLQPLVLFLIPYNCKERILSKMESAKIDVNMLAMFNKEMGEEDGHQLAIEQLEAIDVLRDNINELKEEGDVLIFEIG